MDFHSQSVRKTMEGPFAKEPDRDGSREASRAELEALRRRWAELEQAVADAKRTEAALAERTHQLKAVRAVTAEITREIDLSTLLGKRDYHRVPLG